jgi:hypothetical protein
LPIATQRPSDDKPLDDDVRVPLSDNDFSRPIPLLDNDTWARQSGVPLYDFGKRIRRIVRNVAMTIVFAFLLTIGSFFGLFEIYKQQQAEAATVGKPSAAMNQSALAEANVDAAYAFPIPQLIDLLQPTFEEKMADQKTAAQDEATNTGAENQPKLAVQRGAQQAKSAAGASRGKPVSDAVSTAALGVGVQRQGTEPTGVSSDSNAAKREKKIVHAMVSLQQKTARSCAIYGSGSVGLKISVLDNGTPKAVRVYGAQSKTLLGKCAATIAQKTRFPVSVGAPYEIKRTIRVN